MTKDIGTARIEELNRLAEIWHASWHFAHDGIVDPELVAVRTQALFRERIEGHLQNTTSARVENEPVGLAIIKDEELHQFFLAQQARGTGMAYRLMRVVLDQFAQAGVKRPHLYVAQGNARAIGFYKSTGWEVEKRGYENIAVGEQIFRLPVLVMTRSI